MSSCCCKSCGHDHESNNHDSHKGHHHDGHNHNHSHHSEGSKFKMFMPELISGILLVVFLLIDWSSVSAELIAFIVATLPVGFPILISTFKEWVKGDIFNEFTLMVIASVGAFIIGEFPEGVAVLLFYSIGEKLEDIVSGDVKSQIKKLLGKMPKTVTVNKEGSRQIMTPAEVKPGMTIFVKPGESVPIDGILFSEEGADFNTAAITGESVPRYISPKEEINSGMIPVDSEVEIKVTREFKDSSLSRIMHMIEDASSHRAPSERILRKITRWYTPIVFTAAVLLFIIPWIVGMANSDFDFRWYVWLRRSLVFLVCSCPCALIVSIPLSYFASIGIASKKGILFKGHDSLDALKKVNIVLFDKTGTVTTGKFHVDKIESVSSLGENEILAYIGAVEISSNHPLAQAIVEECKKRGLRLANAQNVKVRNHGITALIEGKEITIGSSTAMKASDIDITDISDKGTSIYLAIDGIVQGIVLLSDTVKENVLEAVDSLHAKGVKEIGILSGDSDNAVKKTQNEINADFGFGNLLPEDKLNIIKKRQSEGYKVAFAGDGINDGPAIATSDVGIAMGTLGTDVAIESAQIVVAGDDLRKISDGIDISRKVKNVIIENVSFAFGVKLIVMILGAFGIASLWAAVFADTGVTLLTVAWTLLRLRIWELKEKPEITR